jgi:hypothetical protein
MGVCVGMGMGVGVGVGMGVGNIHYTVIFNSIYAREMGYNTFIVKIDLNGI